MFYSHKNCPIVLNNSSFFVNTANISYQNSLTPSFSQDDTSPDGYIPENGIVGSLKLTYYLTGRDILKDYISDKTTYVSGYFAGLYFQSGVVKSYSIEGNPNQPVIVSTEIAFFQTLNGTFSPGTANPIPTIAPLNLSDCIITGSGLGNLSAVRGFSYTASLEAAPGFYNSTPVREDFGPNSIVYGPQEVQCSLSYDDISGFLSITGNDGTLNIFLRNSAGQVYETLSISGKVLKKDLNIAASQALEYIVYLRQDSIFPTPVLTGFQPLSGQQSRTLIRIGGSGLKTTSQVFQGRNVLPNVTVNSDNLITVKMRSTPKTGRFTVVTQGGTAITSQTFLVIDGGIGGF